MNQRFSFTKPILEGLLQTLSGQRVTYHDTHKNAAGLQLRVSATAKTFIVQRRVNGKPERVTLGKFPVMTIEQARRKSASRWDCLRTSCTTQIRSG